MLGWPEFRGSSVGRLILLMGVSGWLLSGCGRYSAPIPPFRLAPAAVVCEEIVADAEGVTLKWLGPTTQLRGKELLALDGYRIWRKELPSYRFSRSMTTPLQTFDYKLVGVVEDDSLDLLRAKREELRQKSLPGRSASLSSEERLVTFRDSGLSVGRIYLYKIIPFAGVSAGESSGDAPVKEFIQLLFSGEASRIDRLKSEEQAGSIVSEPNVPVEPIVEEESPLSSDLL